MKTAIAIPTYNEKDNIIPLTEQIFKVIPEVNILIVDDNSPDGTGRIADDLAENHPKIKVLHRLKKEGLGKAYVAAFNYLLSSDIDYIITMDADFSHDPKYLPEILGEIKNHDVIIGSRYTHGISVLNWPLSRLILSVLANKYIKLITGLPLSDCTSGFVCYKKKVLVQLKLENVRSEGYAFLVELKHRAFVKGFRFREVSIVFTERQNGYSKMSKGVVLEALLIPWILRFRSLFRNRYV